MEGMSGKNAEVFLTEVGVAFHRYADILVIIFLHKVEEEITTDWVF